MKTVKYQYTQRSIKADQLEEYLNKLGEQGWRVSFVEHGLVSNYLILFERRGSGMKGKKQNGRETA